MAKRAALLLAFALSCLPAAASAGCASGQTPNDEDIEGISVSRAGFPVMSRPTYEFRFERYNERYYATLTARESVPLRGDYNLRSPDAWPTFVAILERDGFYSLRLTPNPNFALLDPPVDSVAVTRCKVTTSIGLASTLEAAEYDEHFKRYQKLLEDLQTAIFALPWEPVPTPSPARTP